jgi:hypothetical protein
VRAWVANKLTISMVGGDGMRVINTGSAHAGGPPKERVHEPAHGSGGRVGPVATPQAILRGHGLLKQALLTEQLVGDDVFFLFVPRSGAVRHGAPNRCRQQVGVVRGAQQRLGEGVRRFAVSVRRVVVQRQLMVLVAAALCAEGA